MSAGLQIDVVVDDKASPVVQRLSRYIGNPRLVHQFIAPVAENVTRDYLIIQANGRHATARRLGAQPTGHLSRAAESVTSKYDDTAATVGITSPGISRALGPITIKATRRKWLTIPAVGSVYGKKAAEQGDLTFMSFRRGLAALVEAEPYRITTGKKKGEMGKRPVLDNAGRPIIVYWLKKEVTIKEDRSLIPSDEIYKAAAEQGIEDLLDAVTSLQGGAS